MNKLIAPWVGAMILLAVVCSFSLADGDFDPPQTSGGNGTVHCDPAGHCSANFFLSEDGKSIVDKNGNPVAKSSKPLIRPLAGAQSDSKTGPVREELQGCMKCSNECIVYDNQGKCIKTIRSCTWDFNC